MPATTIPEFLVALPEERKAAINDLYKTIKKNIPKGFIDEMSYGCIGFVVPHSIYPKGYHCNPKLPLPLINISNTKGHIGMHHMGLYGSKPLLDWFTEEWKNHSTKKLDMGKGCVRFKKPEDIPLKLIGKLAKKLTPQNWIDIVESTFTSTKK